MGFADDHPTPLVGTGPGDSAHRGGGAGRALAVRAGRGPRAPRAAAGRRGLSRASAADTCPREDFRSGAVRLGHEAGATAPAPAAGRPPAAARAVPHRGRADGAERGRGASPCAPAAPGHPDERPSLPPPGGSHAPHEDRAAAHGPQLTQGGPR